MDNKDVMFKTATMGGFEKRAVLDYIYKINEDMEKERAELLGQIEEAKGTGSGNDSVSKVLNQENFSLQESLSRVSQELADEKDKTAELSEKLIALNLNIDKLKIEKNAMVDSDRIKELEAKQEEIEKSSYQIGRVMLDARTDAEKIVEVAKQQAEKIVNQAENSASEHKLKIETNVGELLENAKVTAETQMQNAKNEKERIVEASNKDAEDIKAKAHIDSEDILNNARTKFAQIMNTSTKVSENSNKNLSDIEFKLNRAIAVLEDSFNNLKEKSAEIQEIIAQAKETITHEQVSIKNIDISSLALEHLLENYKNKDMYKEAENLAKAEENIPFGQSVQAEYTVEEIVDEQEEVVNIKDIDTETSFVNQSYSNYENPPTTSVDIVQQEKNLLGKELLNETKIAEDEDAELKMVLQEPIPVFDLGNMATENDFEVGKETGLLDNSVADI